MFIKLKFINCFFFIGSFFRLKMKSQAAPCLLLGLITGLLLAGDGTDGLKCYFNDPGERLFEGDCRDPMGQVADHGFCIIAQATGYDASVIMRDCFGWPDYADSELRRCFEQNGIGDGKCITEQPEMECDAKAGSLAAQTLFPNATNKFTTFQEDPEVRMCFCEDNLCNKDMPNGATRFSFSGIVILITAAGLAALKI